MPAAGADRHHAGCDFLIAQRRWKENVLHELRPTWLAFRPGLDPYLEAVSEVISCTAGWVIAQLWAGPSRALAY